MPAETPIRPAVFPDGILLEAEPGKPPLVRVGRNNPAPLSYYQERVWKVDQAQGGTAMYNIPFGLRIRGNLDTKALRSSLDDFIQRHEAFRTSFLIQNGSPRQRVHEAHLAPLEETDLRDMPSDRVEREMRELGDKEAHWVFDLTAGPPIHFHLLRIGEREHVLLVNMHHIISDGWSLNIFKRELPELYTSHVSGRPTRLSDIPIQYIDYAVWQRDRLRGAVLDHALEYWRECLRDLPILETPTDYPRQLTPCIHAAKCFFKIPAGVTLQLQAAIRQQQATLFMAMFAMFAWTLHRFTGSHDVTIGTPMANRGAPQLTGIVGLFANTLPTRIHLEGVSILREAVRRAKATVLGAYQRQEMPYQVLVDEIGPTRPAGRLPFFEVTILETRIVRWPTLGDCTVEAFSLAPTIPKYDLALEYWETGGELQGKVTYASERFDKGTIDTLVDVFVQLLVNASERGGAATFEDTPITQVVRPAS